MRGAECARRGSKWLLPMKKMLLFVLALASTSIMAVGFSDPGKEWPMWGGTPDRNMVSGMKGVPTTWDLKTKKNIKWIAELGSQAYGNPVVSGGYVLVGTNNEAMKDPEHQG